MRGRRQLGMRCSSTPRWARGTGGLLLGAGTGAIVEFLLGTALGIRKLNDTSSETAPIRVTMLTAFGLTAAGAATGLTVGLLPPTC